MWSFNTTIRKHRDKNIGQKVDIIMQGGPGENKLIVLFTGRYFVQTE